MIKLIVRKFIGAVLLIPFWTIILTMLSIGLMAVWKVITLIPNIGSYVDDLKIVGIILGTFAAFVLVTYIGISLWDDKNFKEKT